MSQCETRKIVSATQWQRCTLEQGHSLLRNGLGHEFKNAPLEERTDTYGVLSRSIFSYPTIKEAAQLALDVQDACNGSGVAHTLGTKVFPSILRHMEERGKSTDWANAHPVVYLFLWKLMDLSEPMFTANLPFASAYDKVKRLAAGVDPKEVY